MLQVQFCLKMSYMVAKGLDFKSCTDWPAHFVLGINEL